ncbi:uncharacterized protein LOC135374351 [Ornithodoros turicata]|uniref:uncharacterized protein LOC135374351 n=1 Tax=Ornithodoros turicata TaxID=34597 RepID=UPI00313908F7
MQPLGLHKPEPPKTTGTTASERQRLQQLLTAEELGDRRPSQLLRDMQNLLGGRASPFDPALLKELFLQRLPSSVQMILATAATLPLQDLAAHADKIMEVSSPTPVVSAIPTVTPPPALPVCTAPLPQMPAPNTLGQLLESFERLSTIVASALVPRNPRPRGRDPSRRRSPSLRRSPQRSREAPPGDRTGYCRCHRRYGVQAQHCILPFLAGTPVQLAGKPSRRPVTAASASTPDSSRLYFVTDKASGTRFLVDAGAEVSILPAAAADRRRTAMFHLTAVNNTGIPVYRQQSLTIDLGLRRSFPWLFLVAAVDRPILGADFLRHFRLLVHVGRKRLVDS